MGLRPATGVHAAVVVLTCLACLLLATRDSGIRHPVHRFRSVLPAITSWVRNQTFWSPFGSCRTIMVLETKIQKRVVNLLQTDPRSTKRSWDRSGRDYLALCLILKVRMLR